MSSFFLATANMATIVFGKVMSDNQHTTILNDLNCQTGTGPPQDLARWPACRPWHGERLDSEPGPE